MKSRNSLFRNIRIYKLVLLYITIILFLVSFLVLYLNRDLRNYVYSDSRLTFLCVLLWISFILEFSHTLLDLTNLKTLAAADHDLNRLAYLDRLTGIPNRYSCDLIFSQFNTPEKVAHMGCILMSISNLREINETRTHETGDHLITDFCTILESVGTDYGFVGRNSGNEFLLIIDQCNDQKLQDFLNAFTVRIRNHNVLNPQAPIHVSYACLLNDQVHAEKFFEFITRTYAKFHEGSLELI
jgi:diguanylate cyclase (GGDEF)-like protein